jgi:hypothetical protein
MAYRGSCVLERHCARGAARSALVLGGLDLAYRNQERELGWGAPSAPAPAPPRAPGSRLATHHVCIYRRARDTAGLHAPKAMELDGRHTR